MKYIYENSRHVAKAVYKQNGKVLVLNTQSKIKYVSFHLKKLEK